MKKRLTIVLALSLVFTLAFTTTFSVAKTKAEINAEIEEKEDELEKGKAESASLAKDIQELEEQIAASENDLAAIEKEIASTEKKIADAEIQLKEAEEKVNTQEKNLNDRLRVMYKNGSVGFLDVILSSGSLPELISNLEMVKMIYSSDQELLNSLQKHHEKIEKTKKELEELQEQLTEKKVAQSEVLQGLEADKSAVNKKKGIVDANNSELQDNIAALEADAAKTDQIISGSSSGGSYTGPSESQFVWPVPGWTRVSSDYGPRICPFHGREVHSGIDIPASYGTSVVAAASGTVVYSGYLSSYGNTIIIDHGNALYTLYAHNSSLVVRSGTNVSQGQTIARVGSTGNSTGNHSHFEVRKGANRYSNHTSPWNYL